MKKRHSISFTVKQFCRMIDEDSVDFNYPIQRSADQWDLNQKSLLIHSILVDYEIPNIYSVSTNHAAPSTEQSGKIYNPITYSIIDGKQRSTAIYEYCQNLYELDDNIQPIRYGDAIYDISGLSFKGLPPELQEMIHDYTLGMTHFVNITNDELADMFYRLNNGTAMSPQQKMKSFIGYEAATELSKLTKHPFMKEKAILTNSQRKRADDEQVLMQFMMLSDADYDCKNLGAADIKNYAIALKNKDISLLLRIEDVLNFVDKAVDKGPNPMLKKKFMPYLLYVAQIAVEKNITDTAFRDWLNQLTNSENSNWLQLKALMEASNTKRNVLNRIEFLTDKIYTDFKFHRPISEVNTNAS